MTSQYTVNKHNMNKVVEMCALFIKHHQREVDRLSWQKDVLERKEFKYFRIGCDNFSKKTKAINFELLKWRDACKRRYNTIVDPFKTSNLILRHTEQQHFQEIFVDGDDMLYITRYYNQHGEKE